MYTKNKITMRSNFIVFDVYKPIFYLLLIFGYSFNASERKVVKVGIRLYCAFLISLCVYTGIYINVVDDFTQLWSLLEYVATLIIFEFMKDETKLFFNQIAKIDSHLRINHRNHYRNRMKFVLGTFIIWVQRVIYIFIYYLPSDIYEHTLQLVFLQFVNLALDTYRVWRLVLYELIRYRIKTLRLRLEEMTKSDYYLYIENKRSVKETKYRFCLDLYRALADLVDLIVPKMHVSLFISVICSVPKLVINSYHFLLVLEDFVSYESLGIVLMHISVIAFSLFTICGVVELYTAEAEIMKLLLMHKILEGVDDSTKAELRLFMEYITMRPFQYKIFRIIPINGILPLELINICATYVTVMINFTHLY